MVERKESEIGLIPAHWNLKPFHRIIEGGAVSYGIVQPGTHREVDSVPIIRINNIKNGQIVPEDVMKVSQSIEAKYRRTRLEGGELIVTVVGSVGDAVIVPEKFKGWNVARAVSVSKVLSDVDPNFIKYCFSTEQIKHQLYGQTNDTVQPTLNLSSLKEIQFPIPPFPEQKAIAEVLSSLDDKIDLLHRQNKTLESLAQTLFRQWFIEQADESWERSTIGAELRTELGGTPSTTNPEYWDGEIPWINSGEINKFRIMEASKYITELGLNNSNCKMLPKGTTVLAITGATLGQVSLLEIETTANQSVVGVIPNNKLSKEFVFLWVKSKIREIISNETGGAQPHINKNDVNETEIIIPPQNVMDESMPVVSNYFEKITKNVFQIHSLIKLRDSLLPKLMSGEAGVSERL